VFVDNRIARQPIIVDVAIGETDDPPGLRLPNKVEGGIRVDGRC